MSSAPALLHHVLISENNAHRRQVALVRASLERRPDQLAGTASLQGGRRA